MSKTLALSYIIEEEVVNPDSKVEKPTITYENKKLVFHSLTPNVKFINTIKAEDATTGLTAVDGDNLPLSATYIITVYAKTDSLTSEATTATLVWATGSIVDDPTDVKAISVESTPLLITQNGGVITVSGVEDGETLTVYTASGVKVADSTVTSSSVTIDLSTQRGQIIILNVNGKSAKVRVK